MGKNLRMVKLPGGTGCVTVRGVYSLSPANHILQSLGFQIPFGFRELRVGEEIEPGDYVFAFDEDRETLTNKIERVDTWDLENSPKYAFAQYRALRPL